MPPVPRSTHSNFVPSRPEPVSWQPRTFPACVARDETRYGVGRLGARGVARPAPRRCPKHRRRSGTRTSRCRRRPPPGHRSEGVDVRVAGARGAGEDSAGGRIDEDLAPLAVRVDHPERDRPRVLDGDVSGADSGAARRGAASRCDHGTVGPSRVSFNTRAASCNSWGAGSTTGSGSAVVSPPAQPARRCRVGRKASAWRSARRPARRAAASSGGLRAPRGYRLARC